MSTFDTTKLDLGSDASLVQRVAGEQLMHSRAFSFGIDSLVRHCLRHEPAHPSEIEHAIDVTEEAVMPLAAQFSGSSGLILTGVGASLIADGLKINNTVQKTLTVEQVEALFGRLVSVSQGRPVSQENLPTDARFFAALLILREFMHHLHFAQVTLS